MVANNSLTLATPYAVEKTIKQLGADLRTARLRRNLTIGEVARKIGTGTRAVSNAEKGHPSTGVVVYVALLWVYNLLDQLETVADPTLDQEGLALASWSERARARDPNSLDNDF